MIPAQQKQIFRAKLKYSRGKLSSRQVTELSEAVQQKLIDTIDWDSLNSLHIYQAIAKNNEMKTDKIISFAESHGKKIYFPNINKMPRNERFDVVIVPTVGFDRQGRRLGYGGGFYDRFLANNRCGRIIGLAYSQSEVSSITAESHDQKLHSVITENEVIDF